MRFSLHAVGVRAGLTFLCAALCSLAGGAIQSAHGGLFTLTDDNSTASIDTGSSAGMFNWTVDGENQLAQQWFWYRVGNVAGEAPISGLKIALEGTSDLNFDTNPDALFTRYLGNGFQLELRYALDGGTKGSGSSDISEQISIINTTDGPLDFHFFQYSDFDLDGTSSVDSDTAVFTNTNTVRQREGLSNIAETVVTPVAGHREIAFFNATLVKLNDALPTTLSDTPLGTVVGPGDMTWAYQWDFLIPVGGTVQISKDKNLNAVVPEPSSLALASLASLGLLALLAKRRRA